MSREIIYAELSYKINGLCFKVQYELGRFCREKQYADRLEEVLKEKNIEYKREVILGEITNTVIKGNIADFIVEGKIILDLKSKKYITKEDYFQMQRYLKSANIKLGIIVNFRDSYLKPKRIVNNEYD